MLLDEGVVDCAAVKGELRQVIQAMNISHRDIVYVIHFLKTCTRTRVVWMLAHQLLDYREYTPTIRTCTPAEEAAH